MNEKELLEFAHWIAQEVIDEDNWRRWKDAFPEIALRKLWKLGIVKMDGDLWIYNDPGVNK